MRCLTIHQPYAWAIAAGLKPAENRTWMTHHRGPIAIHAGVGVGTKWEFETAIARVADLANQPDRDILRACHVRGAVIAVATLTGVCSGLASGQAWETCECGPWAVRGAQHFRLADVQALPEPVAARGLQRMWTLPDEVEAAVLAQLGAEVPS